MYPFWESIVEPVIRASNARRIVEIGALRGETTALMLDDLGPEAELHVIDPVPEFDPTEHEQRFGGRYVFHRDLSLNVLPTIGATDVALVDGDHNWYTVHNELRVLAETSRREHQPLPVLILHDVCWPYGRRDLYYAPEQIPEEFRQPYRKAGMRPGRKDLLKAGGMNVQLDNALEEGGPRNGVMTALDDFIAEHDRPLRRVVLPIYFGLAIVVEQDRLDTTPALAAELDRIESLTGKDELLELSEQIRLNAVVFEHNVGAHRNRIIDRGVRRYLDVVKHALVGDLDVDNELRVNYLRGCAERGMPPAAHCVRDPVRFLQRDHVEMQAARETGRPLGGDGQAGYAYASMGRARLDHLERTLEAVERDGVAGHLVECATGRGGGGIFMRAFLEAHEEKHRKVWVADPFRYDIAGSDLNQIREGFQRFGLLDDRVKLVQGDYPGTVPLDGVDQIAVLRIGVGAGEDAELILDRSYDLVSDGGFVIIDGMDEPAVRDGVERFRSRRGITAPVERFDWWGVAWCRDLASESPAAAPAAEPETGTPRARAPLAPPAPADALDLTVVVVFHNMKREAERTLHSLSRVYQRDIEDLRYEVLAFDNGSQEDQRLDADFVASFGPEFRLIDMGPDAPGTPTVALNEGMRQGLGTNYLLMIDGAHVLTPGVLHHGMAGIRSYGPAVVATQQWYVGPGQQPDTVRIGYHEGVEDQLFEQIDWPTDGYRLFEIGHIVGDRDWFDGMIESNCLFVPRSIVEQVGGFDDAFAMAGGGYTNLEVYERLSASPDAAGVTIIGEGSFHQVHGGITTNDTDVAARRKKTFEYGEHYQELRGRMLRGPAGFMHYVGSFTNGASRRTRARRMTSEAFAQAGAASIGADGMPTTPEIIPDELRMAFIESFWRSLSWKDSTWLGHRIATAPTDLQIYQELITALRPDWIIETGTGAGGRSLFLGSVCDSIDHGRILSVDPNQPDNLPPHDRVTYLKARGEDAPTMDQVREVVGDTTNALVILGARTGMRRVMREFTNFSPLVPVGSYVIVEQTIINGNPVWPEHGLGPGDAVRQILQTRGDFVADPFMERFGLTFNLGGYLKRVSDQPAQ